MSKKVGLPRVSSIAACLRLASQILSPKATISQPPETLTKDVLAPIVIEAHRFGQCAVKLLGNSGDCVELAPRKFLKLLDKHSEDVTDARVKDAFAAVRGIQVADMTWDFQGSVVDTLEMELEDLYTRALGCNTAICALFSVSASNIEEYAIVWIPAEEAEIAPKHSLLLYVCPGRVKVVKNVVDLIRKMREEMKIVGDCNAVYSVWVLVTAPERVKPDVNTNETTDLKCKVSIDRLSLPKSAGSELSAASAQEQTQQQRSVAINGDVIVDSSGFCLEATHGSDNEHSHNGVSALRNSTSAVFQASRSSPVTNSVSPETYRRSAISESTIDRNQSANPSANPSAKAIPEDVAPPRQIDFSDANDIDTHVAQTRVVASQGTNNTSSGADRVAKNMADWNSQNDGRSLAVVRQSAALPRNSSIASNTTLRHSLTHVSAPLTAKHKDEMSQEATSQDPQELEPELVYSESTRREQSVSSEGQVSDPDQECMEPPRDSCGAVSLTGISGDRSSFVPLSSDPEPQEQLMPPPAYEDVVESHWSAEAENIDAVTESSNDDNTMAGDIDTQLKSASVTGADSAQNVKKKSARDRVRLKLGAKVWWELEYTARQLEHKDSALPKQFRGKTDSAAPSATVARALAAPAEAKNSVATHTQQTRNPKERYQPMSAAIATVSSESASGKGQSALVLETYPDEEIRLRRGEKLQKMVTNSMLETNSRSSDRQLSSSHDGDLSLPRQSLSHRSTDNRALTASAAAQSIAEQTSPNLKCAAYPERREAVAPASVNQLQPRPLSELSRLSVAEMVIEEPESSSPTLKADSSPSATQLPTQPDRIRLSSYSTKSETRAKAGPSSKSSPGQSSVVASASRRRWWHDEDEDSSGVADNNNEEDSQAQWAQTLSSRDSGHHDTNGSSIPVKGSNTTTALPFHMNGRVPIRSQYKTSAPKHECNQPGRKPERVPSNETTLELDSHCVSARSQSNRANGASHSEIDDETIPDDSLPHGKLDKHTNPRGTAAFISIGSESAVKDEATSQQDRLNELRQRKLDQLQRARNLTLQQQRKKTQHRQQPSSSNQTSFDPPTVATASLGAPHHPLKVKRPSNRQLMQNALEFTLLAGASNERDRLAALEALAQSPADNFIVLLKSAKELKFRALYESQTELDEARRLFSTISTSKAPLRLATDVVAQFFKYSSAKKQFLPVDTRSFTVTTDACALVDQLVFKKTKPSLAKLL